MKDKTYGISFFSLKKAVQFIIIGLCCPIIFCSCDSKQKEKTNYKTSALPHSENNVAIYLSSKTNNCLKSVPLDMPLELLTIKSNVIVHKKQEEALINFCKSCTVVQNEFNLLDPKKEDFFFEICQMLVAVGIDPIEVQKKTFFLPTNQLTNNFLLLPLLLLPNLRKINLSHNDISQLPPEIGNLKNLEVLELSYNNLSTLPETIIGLTNLVKLDLNNNQFKLFPKLRSENNDDKKSGLFNLTWLSVSSNQIYNIPNWLSTFKKIKQLYFQNNSIQSLPENLSQLVHVERLVISNNQLRELPFSFYPFVNKKILNWTNNAWIHPSLLKITTLYKQPDSDMHYFVFFNDEYFQNQPCTWYNFLKKLFTQHNTTPKYTHLKKFFPQLTQEQVKIVKQLGCWQNNEIFYTFVSIEEMDIPLRLDIAFIQTESHLPV